MALHAVLLDFYGTLAESTGWAGSWEQVVAESGYTLPDEVRDRWWSDALDGVEHDEHSASRDDYVAWQRARMAAMLAECGVPADDADDIIARVREIGAHRAIEAFEETGEVLDELRGRGLRLVVCSNWDWDLVEAVEAAGLADHVDALVSSAWVGARKPHPRMYARALAEVEVAPHEACFVGDTWAADVAGPRAFGVPAVYLSRPHRPPDTTRPDGDPGDVPLLPDLRDLPAVLATLA